MAAVYATIIPTWAPVLTGTCWKVSDSIWFPVLGPQGVFLFSLIQVSRYTGHHSAHSNPSSLPQRISEPFLLMDLPGRRRLKRSIRPISCDAMQTLSLPLLPLQRLGGRLLQQKVALTLRLPATGSISAQRGKANTEPFARDADLASQVSCFPSHSPLN